MCYSPIESWQLRSRGSVPVERGHKWGSPPQQCDNLRNIFRLVGNFSNLLVKGNGCYVPYIHTCTFGYIGDTFTLLDCMHVCRPTYIQFPEIYFFPPSKCVSEVDYYVCMYVYIMCSYCSSK